MRSEDIKVGMRVVVRRSDPEYGGQVGLVTHMFGHPSDLAVDLSFESGGKQLFLASNVWPYGEEMGQAQEATG